MSEGFEGRQREIQWLGETAETVSIRGDPFHFIHLYGPAGVGVSRLATEWLGRRSRQKNPSAVWELSKVFRFTPLAECARYLLDNRSFCGIQESAGFREAEEQLKELVENERRRQLSDGSLLLYRNQGGYRAGRGATAGSNAPFQRDLAKRFRALWTGLARAGPASDYHSNGIFVLRIEDLLASPQGFQRWLGTDLVEHLRGQPLGWPLIVLSTARDAFPLLDPQAYPGFSGNWVSQLRLEPLSRPNFFAFLDHRQCPREAWEWLYAECAGIPGRLEKALQRWEMRVQNVGRDKGFDALLPASVERPLPPHCRLWIQAAAAFGVCREECLTVLLGRRESVLAMVYLRNLPIMQRTASGDAIEIETVTRAEILAWMTRHQSPLLEECREYARLIDELVSWAPRPEDRMHLSYLAPLPEFDRNLLEAVFPA